MPPTCRIVRAWLLAAVVSTTGLGWAEILYVPDPDAGIITMADALAIAQPGDTLVIVQDIHERVVISTNDLTITSSGDVVWGGGEYGNGTPYCSATVPPEPPITVSNATNVFLVGLTFQGIQWYCMTSASNSALNTGGFIHPITISNSTVSFLDCILDRGPGGDVQISDSTVEMKECVFPESDGISATNSSIRLVDCQVFSRNGTASWSDPYGPGGWSQPICHTALNGSPCAQLNNACLSTLRTSFLSGNGGAGGTCSFSAAHAASAVILEGASSAILQDSSIICGSGGSSRISHEVYHGSGGDGGSGILRDDESFLVLLNTSVTPGLGGPGETAGLNGETVVLRPTEISDDGTPCDTTQIGFIVPVMLSERVVQFGEPGSIDLNSDGLLDVGDAVLR